MIARSPARRHGDVGGREGSPRRFVGKGIAEIVDTRKIIRRLEREPVILGHLFGGPVTSSGDLDGLIERFLDAQAALLDHVKQLDRERKDLDRIKALLQR